MLWQLQTAKQKFSELVDKTLADGPQVVTRRGREVVVVVSIEEYRRLKGRKMDFKQFLTEGPPYFDDLEIERSSELSRPVDLE
jgi:prevent-host-death family protein